MFWQPNSPLKAFNEVSVTNRHLGKNGATKLSDLPEFEDLLPNFSGFGEDSGMSSTPEDNPESWEELRKSYADPINPYYNQNSGCSFFSDPRNVVWVIAGGLILYLLLKD